VAQRIERFSTVAAVGASDSFVDHDFLDGTVTRVELYVPAGHAGLTEWSFWFATAQLIPKTAGTVIVADDKEFGWDVEDAPTGSGYRSRVTNDDVFAHSFHVEVWIDELVADEPAAGVPVLVIPFTGGA